MWAWRGVPEALAISFTGSVTAWIMSMGRGLRGLIVKLDEGQSSELRAQSSTAGFTGGPGARPCSRESLLRMLALDECHHSFDSFICHPDKGFK